MTQWKQERLFSESGPFIHLYTSPLEKDVLAENDDDRTTILNSIALSNHKARTEVLAYALMSNHIHLILKGDEMRGRAMYDILAKRLARYLAARGKPGILKKTTCGITAITDLKQLRNELAYVIRNPFVVREDINLFAYRWCSGYLYFNPLLSTDAGEPATSIKYRERRTITRSSEEEIPEHFRVENGLILPESFVNYKLAESLFGTARQFLYWTLKNVEAQVQLAHTYGERPMVSDDELFVLSRDLCESKFATRQPKELTAQQKMEYAIDLRNRYHASNGQLARLTTLSLQEINRLYPLSAKS